ncbi:MAG: DNA/RNA non-specific endonuclease [Flavobacteriales bacterium]
MWPIFLFAYAVSAQTLEQNIESVSNQIAGLKAAHDSLSGQLEDLKFQAARHQLAAVGLPETASCDEVIYHTAYALVYDETHEQAKWVAHLLLPDVAAGTEGRTNDFRPDPLIKSGSAVDEDYALKTKTADGKTKTEGFGYDRGHLAPSADFRYSKKALSESYYYSNMSPQTPGLNRGRWSDLEDAMRSYCVRENTPLYIVTGGVLSGELSKLEQGVNKVTIPKYYYKVALDLEHRRAIGFLMPNEKCEYKLDHYCCSIDSIEKITGLNFFHKLSDETENQLESSVSCSSWIPAQNKQEAEVLDPTSLPRNTFNTEQAAFYAGKRDEITVCGKVVSTKLSAKGNIFLNLDKPFPNHIFTVTIFKDQVPNFSYAPQEFLKDKTICVKGTVTKDANGVAGMIIKNESAIEVTD